MDRRAAQLDGQEDLLAAKSLELEQALKDIAKKNAGLCEARRALDSQRRELRNSLQAQAIKEMDSLASMPSYWQSSRSERSGVSSTLRVVQVLEHATLEALQACLQVDCPDWLGVGRD